MRRSELIAAIQKKSCAMTSGLLWTIRPALSKDTVPLLLFSLGRGNKKLSFLLDTRRALYGKQGHAESVAIVSVRVLSRVRL